MFGNENVFNIIVFLVFFCFRSVCDVIKKSLEKEFLLVILRKILKKKLLCI